MKRLAALALAVPAILLAGLALGPGDVRAGEQDRDEKKVEKRVIVRPAGRSMLGVGLDETEGELRGAKVRSVEEGSPAEKAGIKGGDVIVRFDGIRVDNIYDYTFALRSRKPGQDVRITVKRGGQELDLVATLGRRP